MTREERIERLKMLVERFEPFAAHTLNISDKDGNKVPFMLNEAQAIMHARVERQLKEIGKVRVILCKARQLGLSTYVAGRFYWKTSTIPGKRALIVGHEAASSDSLFNMVKFFRKHSPLQVSVAKSNFKEFAFDKLESGYRVATAGTDDVGRGHTFQYGHLSEFAFWGNGKKQLAGLGNTISNNEGTEIIIESTANGVSGAFYELWHAAEEGNGEWMPVFIPWYVNPRYATPPRSTLNLSSDDELYMRTYSLSLSQMQFRADKLVEYGDDMAYLWSQEYPGCAQESFVIPQGNPLINPTLAMQAVASRHLDHGAPLVIGCDPAGDGVNDADRTAIAFRRGRVLERIEYHSGLDTMGIAGKLAEIWRDHRPDAIFVDKGGLGAGVVDRLTELNIPNIGVLSATRADDHEIYENRRAEMWWRMRDWFADQPCRIPNNQALLTDITAPQPKVSSNGRKLLEKKEDMKRRGLRSPDGGDSVALTFAYEVHRRNEGIERRRVSPTNAGY